VRTGSGAFACILEGNGIGRERGREGEGERGHSLCTSRWRERAQRERHTDYAEPVSLCVCARVSLSVASPSA
jgi:hypothetical protein